MKIRTLILGVILIFVVLVIVGNNVTIKKAYAQEKPSIDDIVGIWWVNTKMIYDKFILPTNGTRAIYHYLDQKEHLPSLNLTFTIEDSWVDKDRNKYFKVHAIQDLRGMPGFHFFEIWKINEAGTVFELNSYEDALRREGDPDKYPAGINPHPTDSSYFIYYLQ